MKVLSVASQGSEPVLRCVSCVTDVQVFSDHCQMKSNVSPQNILTPAIATNMHHVALSTIEGNCF